VANMRFPIRTTAVTESRIPGVPGASGASPGPAGRARIRTYEPERVVVDTDGARRSILVLTDSWYPGWKATVDGKDASVHRVDYVVRGVAVPAGRHRVEFRYAPVSWRVGWIVSLLAGVLIVVTAVVGWRRRAAGAPTAAPV
jgi:membrane protein YfhO